MELNGILPISADNVELFRMFWPPDPHLVQARAGVAMVVMTRQAAGGGFLVCLPSALVPAGSLPIAPLETDAIGPHTRMEVPAVRLTETSMESLGIDLDVQIIDLSVAALPAITPLSQLQESEDQGLVGFGEDLDVIPDPTLLLTMVSDWLSGEVAQRAAFYSAEEGVDEMPDVEDGQATPTAFLPPRQEAALGITPPASPKAKAKEAPKKRVTAAAVQEQLSGLLELIPAMSAQISELQKGQHAIQQSMAEKNVVPPPRPSQLPVSGTVAHFAKMMGSPPKTRPLVPAGPTQPLIVSGLDANLPHQAVAEESSPISADPIAKAVMEQSKALMSLVAHMQQGGDPLLDGQGSSSSGSLGTRGSQGREKLQRDLSMKSGSFFLAVLQNAAKRLRPAAARPASIEELASTDFSMIHYLERFGGYGSYKELGLIQYALAHICDALVHSDLNGARDYLALLMVGVDQANLDGNRWELAYRMMLLEEPPSQLWAYRNQSFDPRSKSFSPLAPQQWTTVALAYSKEMDYIQTKRLEVTKPKAAQNPPAASPNPKRRGRFPKAKAAASTDPPE